MVVVSPLLASRGTIKSNEKFVESPPLSTSGVNSVFSTLMSTDFAEAAWTEKIPPNNTSKIRSRFLNLVIATLLF